MLERDWDRDFDLTAWRALSRQHRKSWIEQAWRREDEREARGGAGWELPVTAWQRYERGQTVWDIGLDPQPFDLTLAEAVGEVKPELPNGVVFGSTDVRDRVLSALLANAGLRRVVRLASLPLWRQVLSKERFRAMFRDYRERCARGEIRVGQSYLYTASQPWILNFPTKDHWRNPSRLVWIRDGLEHFAQHYREWGVTSIAFPQLGTQHGKLAWEQVRPVMHEVLDPLELDVLVYTLDSPTDDDIVPDDRLPETQPRLLWGRMARHTPTRGTLPRGRRLACRRRSQR